jgi:amino acid adenylation domain-containing protein
MAPANRNTMSSGLSFGRSMQMRFAHISPHAQGLSFLQLCTAILASLVSGGLTSDFDLLQLFLNKVEPEHAFGYVLGSLESLLSDPRSLAPVVFLSPQETTQILAGLSIGAAGPNHLRLIHKAFEEQAALTPDAVAVVHAGERLTYGELNGRANQLAHHLIALGVGADVPVALCLERSPDMVISLLAVLKAGGIYVPLDPAYPPERLAFVLDDIRAPVLVTERRSAANLPAYPGATILPDTDRQRIGAHNSDNPTNPVAPEQTAYVIYTSGSTGKPKGVEVTHRGLANYVAHAGDFFALTAADRVLQFASISFDTAAEEIFCALTCGATLVLRNDAMLSSVPDFLDTCKRWGITVLDLPTAYWHELTATIAAEHLSMPDSMRLVVIGGEKAIPERLAQWQAHVGSAIRLCNSYGPSEATIVATMCDLNDDRDPGTSIEVPIGYPIANIDTYVLDRNLNSVPVGVGGELFIGGAGLARGYRNRPELTAEAFIPNPFSREPGSRLYRTGDLVQSQADGSLEFLGRVDHQVKIRGFRIELEEIESVLRQHAAVWESVVVARENNTGDKQLVS